MAVAGLAFFLISLSSCDSGDDDATDAVREIFDEDEAAPSSIKPSAAATCQALP